MPLKLTTYHAGSDIPPLPGNDTFHSTALFRTYEATPGYSPLLIVASLEGQPVAKLLAVVRRSVRLFPPSIIHRCEVFGNGEYLIEGIDREAVFKDMLQRLTEEALRSCFLIEFRNLPDARFGYRSFRSCSYFPINWLRVRNSLHDTPRTEVRFSPSRIRQIKKGLKNGAEVRVARTIDEIKEFAHMLHHVYSWKIRRHFPSREFFRQLALQATDPQRQSRIFIVTYKNKIIGGSACIYSGDNAYLWFSGGMRKTYALQYPGVLAVWKALDDARQQGYRHLEFLDVGLPFRHHGYREFVLRFGGKQISTRRWFRFRWKWLNRVLTWIYK
ncbi:MAG TPA: GNAT family N-acetyltransferase [Bacteroides togonis]|nr:GNAT family N-acetyltransferase [Bacteroides togonis]